MNKKKLLIINKEYPVFSEYCENTDAFGIWLLAKRIDKYVFLILSDDGGGVPEIFNPSCDVMEAQEQLNTLLQGVTYAD